MPPSGAQSVRTNRSSFGSSNANENTPLHSYATVSNGDDYDSDGSNFAPPWASSFFFFEYILECFELITYTLLFNNSLFSGKWACYEFEMLANVKPWKYKRKAKFLNHISKFILWSYKYPFLLFDTNFSWFSLEDVLTVFGTSYVTHL